MLRDQRLEIRLTVNEKRTLENLAQTFDQPTGEYVRNLLFRASPGNTDLPDFEALEKRLSRLEEMAGL